MSYLWVCALHVGRGCIGMEKADDAALDFDADLIVLHGLIEPLLLLVHCANAGPIQKNLKIERIERDGIETYLL